MSVTIVAEMLNVGAEPAMPIAIEWTNPNESFLSSDNLRSLNIERVAVLSLFFCVD
jgi:hypothetical protein